ncbi:MAG: TrkH family potassium uptake protein [Nitrospiria bacterium]
MRVWIQRLKEYRASPAQILILGFLIVILAGTLLLSLPFAVPSGKSLHWIDALFTSTSAVCVTGLIVKDTPSDFTLFGQVIILLLIQIGGLGYTTFTTVIFLFLGKRISIRERLVMKEALNVLSTEGILNLTKWIVMITLVVELAGTVILSLRFLQQYDTLNAVYLALFHSISAFNNAGFSLFSNSLVGYRGDVVVNLVIGILIILGGIGFIVYGEIFQYYFKKEVYRLSIHTRLVLIMTTLLITVGTLAIYLFESGNGTMHGFSISEKLMASFFQSVSARTAGFNTLDVSAMFTFTLYFVIMLMLIGGSPGSTGGGIKTTTFGIMMVALWSTMRGRRDVTLFYRRVPPEIISRAFFLAFLAMLFVTGFTLVLLYVEEKGFIPTLFEVVSGMATVGLSTGDGGVRSLSALFNDFGKLVMILAMFMGRLGPLTIGIGAMGTPRHERYRYPEEKVIIG